MSMGHIERGVDAAIEINALVGLLSEYGKALYANVLTILEECGNGFDGQDVLPNSEAEISNLLVNYGCPDDVQSLKDVPEEEVDDAYEAHVTKQARTIKAFADIVEKETGLVLGLVYADGDNGGCYDDVSNVWVWFGCNLRETIDTEVGKDLKTKGVTSKPVRWSDYG